MLEAKGFDVKEAENGAEGLVQLRQYRFDVVITDVVMPELDGIQFVKKIKYFAVDSHIIVMSGARDYRGVDIKKEAGRLGIAAFFQKPASMKELTETVSDLANKPKAAV